MTATTLDTPSRPADGLRPRLLLTMAVASGLGIANIYYGQPLLPLMGRAFGASASAMGVIAMLTQVGFATGILLFVPFGDVFDRRRLILAMLAGSAVSLVGVAMAPSYVWLAVASVFVGAFSVSPQMLVPFAAHLARPERRGQAVGTVMSGLLTGILLSRTASGYVGARFGWRAMYELASGLMWILAAVLALSLPHTPAGERLSYARLMRSLWRLVIEQPVLRESAVAGAMLFGAFSAFWATLAFRLEAPPLHYGSQVAGLFGLVGVVGAGSAAFAGRLADRLEPRVNLRIALAVTALAFVVFWGAGHTLLGLTVGVILLDAGVQGGHVTNQSRIYALTPAAPNRLNTIYMVSYFVGGSTGSALAANAWQRWQWPGVCAVGVLMLLAGAIPLLARRTT